jgi:hypothetical protein
VFSIGKSMDISHVWTDFSLLSNRTLYRIEVSDSRSFELFFTSPSANFGKGLVILSLIGVTSLIAVYLLYRSHVRGRPRTKCRPSAT